MRTTHYDYFSHYFDFETESLEFHYHFSPPNYSNSQFMKYHRWYDNTQTPSMIMEFEQTSWGHPVLWIRTELYHRICGMFGLEPGEREAHKLIKRWMKDRYSLKIEHNHILRF